MLRSWIDPRIARGLPATAGRNGAILAIELAGVKRSAEARGMQSPLRMNAQHPTSNFQLPRMINYRMRAL
jgi:hypothetical protein